MLLYDGGIQVDAELVRAALLQLRLGEGQRPVVTVTASSKGLDGSGADDELQVPVVRGVEGVGPIVLTCHMQV